MEDPDIDFSVIKFIKLLERRIASVDRYPVNAQTFTIQQDEYQRLATDPEPYEDEKPVAILDNNKKQSDKDLRFAFEFFQYGLEIHIEGGGLFACGWYDFDSETDAVEQVVASMMMLSNGQITVLSTTRNGRQCAAELLLKDQDSTIPRVIVTLDNYRWWWRKDDETGYEFDVLENNYPHDNVKTPKNFFLMDYEPNGEITQRGRAFNNAVLSPLTKKMFEKVDSELIFQAAGKEWDDDNELAFLYRSWEFWIFAMLYAAGVVTLFASNVLPDFVDYLGVVFAFIFFFICGATIIPLLTFKEELKKENPEHLWFKIDTFFLLVFSKTAGNLVLTASLFSTTFMPLYMLKGDNSFVTFYSAAESYPVLYGLLAVLAIPILMARMKSKLEIILTSTSLLIFSVGLFVFNDFFTDTSVTSPEPYTTVIIVSILAAIICSATWIIRALRNKDTQVNTEALVSTEEGLLSGQQQKGTRIAQGIVFIVGLVALSAGVLTASAVLERYGLADSRTLFSIVAASCYAGFLGLQIAYYKNRVGRKRFYGFTFMSMLAPVFIYAYALDTEKVSEMFSLIAIVASVVIVLILRMAEHFETLSEHQDLRDRTFPKNPKQP